MRHLKNNACVPSEFNLRSNYTEREGGELRPSHQPHVPRDKSHDFFPTQM
jgi:hypothetical protein